MVADARPLPLPSDRLEPLLTIERSIDRSALAHELLELVRLRVSQLNGCAYCTRLHTGLLTDGGTTPERIEQLSTWPSSTLYSAKEQAALAWAEWLTGNRRDIAAPAIDAFSDEERVDLSSAIAMINLWNRLAIALHW